MQNIEMKNHPGLRKASTIVGSVGLAIFLAGVIMAIIIANAKLKPGDWDLRGVLAIFELLLALTLMNILGVVAMGLALSAVCRKQWKAGLVSWLALNTALFISGELLLIFRDSDAPGWSGVVCIALAVSTIAFCVCSWIARCREVPGKLPLFFASTCLIIPAGTFAVFFAVQSWG